jgi:SAM-dependent methyltransferase
VHGIDLERGMVEVASQRAEEENLADRVEFTVADLANLAMPDDSVDLIVSTASLHHWTDVSAVIASLDRVLRPHGRTWIYGIRWVSAASVRAASAGLGRRVDEPSSAPDGSPPRSSGASQSNRRSRKMHACISRARHPGTAART